MNKGLWVWPSDPRLQRRVVAKLSEAQHLVPAMIAISKGKEGLSNAELDDLIGDNSNWMTLWVIRQLTSLGFIEFKVDLFGGPAKYRLTELGRSVLAAMAGQSPQPKPPTGPPLSSSPAPQSTVAPKTPLAS